MSKKYVSKLKKILALAVAFAMAFGIMPMQALASQQDEDMLLAGYALSFAGDDFPSTYEASVGERNLVFSQSANVTFAESEYSANDFAPFMDTPSEESPQDNPVEEDLPIVAAEEPEEDVEDEQEEAEEEGTEEEEDIEDTDESEEDTDELEEEDTDESEEEDTDESEEDTDESEKEDTDKSEEKDTDESEEDTDESEEEDTEDTEDTDEPEEANDELKAVEAVEAEEEDAPEEAKTLFFASRVANTAAFGSEPIFPVFDLFWYQDDVRRDDKGTKMIALHDIGINSLEMELAFDEVTVEDMGVWTLRAYSSGGEYVKSPHALFLQVGEVEAVETVALAAMFTPFSTTVMDQAGLLMALRAVDPGDPGIITLGTNITYDGSIVIDGGRDITFNLAGHTLDVNSIKDAMEVSDAKVNVTGGTLNLTATKSAPQWSTGLTVNDGGEVTINGAILNATSYVGDGVEVWGTGSKATVTSATSHGDGGNAVFAGDGATVTVNGNATAYGDAIPNRDGYFVGGNGVWASDATITVSGDAIADGDGGNGAFANDGGTVTVNSAIANGDVVYVTQHNYYYGGNGALAEHGATVTVNGNAIASGAGGDGAFAYGGATVNVTGSAKSTSRTQVAEVWVAGARADGGTVNVAVDATAELPEYSSGVDAYNGGTVKVGGEAKGDRYGVWAEGNTTTVEVVGPATAIGAEGFGVAAAYGGNIEVTGDVTAMGKDSIGANVRNGGEIIINGEIKVASAAPSNYVVVQGNHKEKDDYGLSADKPNYFMYASGDSVVWVKISDLSALPFTLGLTTVDRTNTSATVTFVGTKAGTYHYQISETPFDDEQKLIIDDDTEHESMTAWTANTIHLTELELDEQTLHIVGMNTATTPTEYTKILEVTIPAYVAPPSIPWAPTPTQPPTTTDTARTVYSQYAGSTSTTSDTNEPVNATISFGGASGSRGVNFNPSRPRDVSVTLNAGSSSLRSLRLNGKILEEGVDYTISGDKVILKADFLATLPRGRTVITFMMAEGNSPTLIINVRGTAAS